MSSLKHTKKVMIVAGETSGDMHGAKLVEAMKFQDPNLHFYGIGSNELKEQGVEILYESHKIAVVGIVEVLFHLSDIRNAMNTLTSKLYSDKPALLILIDFPDFNLMLAKKAKKIGIPVFYYISPQVWAWRSGRVSKIAELVSQLAVILPFEKFFYQQRGMNHVEFVGHPLVDSVNPSISKDDFRLLHNIPSNATVVGILPGSRKKEISSILNDLIEAAKLLKQEENDLYFVLVLAPTIDNNTLGICDTIQQELSLKIITEDRYSSMAACDIAMVASGTVTLELAILNIPMVVVYRVSPLTYFLGKRLIKVKFASLVNLVAQNEVVKELLQDDFTPINLKNALSSILPNQQKNIETHEQLSYVSSLLGAPGASKNVANLAFNTMNIKTN